MSSDTTHTSVGSFAPIQSVPRNGAATATAAGSNLLLNTTGRVPPLGSATAANATSQLVAPSPTPNLPPTLGTSGNTVRPISELYNAFMKNTYTEASRVYVGGMGVNQTSTSRFRAAVARYRISSANTAAAAAANNNTTTTFGTYTMGNSVNIITGKGSFSADGASGDAEAIADAVAVVGPDSGEAAAASHDVSITSAEPRTGGQLPSDSGLVGGAATTHTDVADAAAIEELLSPPPTFTTPQPIPETFAQFYLHKVATVQDEDKGVVLYPNIPFGSNVFGNAHYDAICAAVADERRQAELNAIQMGGGRGSSNGGGGSDDEGGGNGSIYTPDNNSLGYNPYHAMLNNPLMNPLYMAETTRQFISETAIRDVIRQQDVVNKDMRRGDSQFHMRFLSAGAPSLTVAYAGGACLTAGGERGHGKDKDKNSASGTAGHSATGGAHGVSGGGSSATAGGAGQHGAGASQAAGHHPFAAGGGVHSIPKHTFYGVPDKRIVESSEAYSYDAGRFLASINRLGSCNAANAATAPVVGGNGPITPIAAGQVPTPTTTDPITGGVPATDADGTPGTLMPGVPFRVYTACVIEKLNTAQRTDTTSAANTATEALLGVQAQPQQQQPGGGASSYLSSCLNSMSLNNGVNGPDGAAANRPTSPLPAIADSASVDDFTGFALLHSRAMPPRFMPAGGGVGGSMHDGAASALGFGGASGLGYGTTMNNQADLGSPYDIYCTVVLYRPKQKASPAAGGPNATGTGVAVPINDETNPPRSEDNSFFNAGDATGRNRSGSFISGVSSMHGATNPRSATSGTSPTMPFGGTQRSNGATAAMNSNIMLCAAHRQHDAFAKRYRECCELDYECFIQETVVIPWATKSSTLEYTNVIAQQSWDAEGRPFLSIGGGLLFVKTMQNTNTTDAHEKRQAVVSRVGFVDIYKYVRETCITERLVARMGLFGGAADNGGIGGGGDGALGGGDGGGVAADGTLLTTIMPSGLTPGAGGRAGTGGAANPHSNANAIAKAVNDITVPKLFPQELVFWNTPSDGGKDDGGMGGSGYGGEGSGGMLADGSSPSHMMMGLADTVNGSANAANNTFISVAVGYVSNGDIVGTNGMRNADSVSSSGASTTSNNMLLGGGYGAGGGMSVTSGYGSATEFAVGSGQQQRAHGSSYYGGVGGDHHGGGAAASPIEASGYPAVGPMSTSNLLRAGFAFVPVPIMSLFNYSSICIATCYSHYTEEQLLAEGYGMGRRGTQGHGYGSGHRHCNEGGSRSRHAHTHLVDISYRCAGVVISVSSNNQIAVARLTRKQQYYGMGDFDVAYSGENSPKGSPELPSTPTQPTACGLSAPPTAKNASGSSDRTFPNKSATTAALEELYANTYPSQEITMNISIPTTLPWHQRKVVQELIDFRIPMDDDPSYATPSGDDAANGPRPADNTPVPGDVGTTGGADSPANNTAAPNGGTANDDDAISCRIANSAGQQYIMCFAQDLVESQWMGTLLHVQCAPFFLRHQHYTYLSYYAQRAHHKQPWRDEFRHALRSLPVRFFEGPNAHSTFDMDPRQVQQLQLQPIVQCVATFTIQKQITKAYYCSRDRILIMGAADGTAAVVGEGSTTWQTLFEPVKRRKAAMTDAEAASALAINTVASVRIPTATLKKRSTRFGAKGGAGAKGGKGTAATAGGGSGAANDAKEDSTTTNMDDALAKGAASTSAQHFDPTTRSSGAALQGGSEAMCINVACPTAAPVTATDEETLQAYHKLLRTTFNIRGAFAEAVFEEIFSPLAMLMGGASMPRHFQKLSQTLTHSGNVTPAGAPQLLTMAGTDGAAIVGSPSVGGINSANGGTSGSSNATTTTTAKKEGGGKGSSIKKEADSKGSGKKGGTNSPPNVDGSNASFAFGGTSAAHYSYLQQHLQGVDGASIAPSFAPTTAEILSNRKDVQMMVEVVDVEPTLYHDVYMVTSLYAAALIHVAIRKTQQTVTSIVVEEEEEVVSEGEGADAYRPQTLESISHDVSRNAGLSSNGTSRSNKSYITLSHRTLQMPDVKTVSLAYVLRVVSRKVGHYTSVGITEPNRVPTSSSSSGILSFFRRSKKDGSSGGGKEGAGGVGNASVSGTLMDGSGSSAGIGGVGSGALVTASSAGGAVSGSGNSKKDKKHAEAVNAANAATLAFYADLLAGGGPAAGLTQTRFNLLHVHLPSLLQDNGIVPPLAFLSAPIAFTRHNQHKDGAVAGKVSSGCAVLVHTTVDPRRLDAPPNHFSAWLNSNGVGTLGGGNGHGGVHRAAARARQILIGGGSGAMAIGALNNSSSPYQRNGGAAYTSPNPALMTGYQQQSPRNPTISNAAFLNSISMIGGSANDVFASSNTDHPASFLSSPPYGGASGLNASMNTMGSVVTTDMSMTASSVTTQPHGAFVGNTTTSSMSPPPQSTRSTMATTTGSSTITATNTANNAKSSGGVGRFFSKLFGSSGSGEGKSSGSGKSSSKKGGMPAPSNAGGSTNSLPTTVAAFPTNGSDAASVVTTRERSLSQSTLNTTVNAAAPFAKPTDNASFALMTTLQDGSGYRQSAPLGGFDPVRKGGDKDAGSATGMQPNGGALVPSNGYYNTSSATDVEVVSIVHASHHWFPERETLEEVRGAPLNNNGSRDDGLAEEASAPYPTAGTAGTRRLRRIQRVAHSIEAPIIVSLTSYKATNPNYYPDLKSVAVGPGPHGGGHRYATSLSWGVAAYQHPTQPPTSGILGSGASEKNAAANKKGANGGSPVTTGVVSPSGYQYTYHPGSPTSNTNDLSTTDPSTLGNFLNAPAPEPPARIFRTRPIIQPDLLERFDVYRLDCTSENTVNNLCDGYSRKVSTGEEVPVTVVALDGRLHGVLCILHMPGKASDHEIYCFRDESVHEGLSVFSESTAENEAN